MTWKTTEPNVIDLSGLPELPDRIELHAQGKDADGEFECRQARHDFRREVTTTPKRNRKGEIEAVTTEILSIDGATLDGETRKVTMPARPGWPSPPFTMVKAVAVYEDESKEDVVLLDKVPAE
jgi:hypothetical protein